MQKFNIIISLSLISLLMITSCKKDKETTQEYDSTKKGKISVEFDNVAGSNDLQLATANYTNTLGETYNVTKLKYFVSNFIFTKSDGSTYIVPQDSSYFLIDESNNDRHKAAMYIPEGEYKTVSFLLGVDSLRNTKDISQRTGDLDVTQAASDMYWSWNSGYIFFKIEGVSTSVPAMGGVYNIHVGGFGGYSTPTPNNLKTVTLDLSARGSAKVKASKTSGVNVHTLVDVNKVFGGTNNIRLTSNYMIHSITAGVPVADNLSTLFSHDHTEN